MALDGIAVLSLEEKDFIWRMESCHVNYKESYFDSMFKSTWRDAEKKKILNYGVENVYTKVLPGYYKIIAQLNPMRINKRRTPEAISCINQPFDSTKFNFTLVTKEEILFEIIFKKLFSTYDEKRKEKVLRKNKLTSTLIVNTAPITPFHSLLVPSRIACNPQMLDYEGLILGISSVLVSNTPALKVGFNSLGGMASVNHHHLHIYYLPYPFYVETAECEKRAGSLYTFKHHYAPGFVFQLRDEDVESLVRDTLTLVDFLLHEEICHNVMITRGISSHYVKEPDSKHGNLYDTVRVCIWVRKPSYGVKQTEGFSTALCELAGHLPIYDEKTWETITEDDVVKAMRDVCSETYLDILPKIEHLFS